MAGLDGGLEGKRMIVQGFGNVGYNAAKFFVEEEGVRLVGVIEYDGALLSDDGLDPEALAGAPRPYGRLQGFSPARVSSRTAHRSFRRSAIFSCLPLWRARSPPPTPRASARS